jgi:hypothetical protein
MLNQPIPAKIILNLADKNSIGEDFLGLSTALYKENLICSEPRELRLKKGKLELTVIFYDYKSFKQWTKDKVVTQYWAEKFERLLIRKPRTIREKDVIIETDKIENCECQNSEFYILQGRSLRFIDELTCGSCLKQIPYSKVPIDIKLENWQRHYQRTYLNWLESSFFEKSAYNELTNYKKGKLNLEGEKIRKQLSTFFNLPVYISYFVEQPDNDHPCLICGQEGSYSGLKRPSKICKECNTIFGY